MIRLLHISDIHLNTGFASKERVVREQLKEGLMKSFENAIHYALGEAVDGVIIAGDFLDNGKVSYKMEQDILNLMEQLLKAEKHVFYATGNHDPMNTLQILNRLEANPYFHCFEDDDIKHICVEMKSGEWLEVVGCGHKSKNEKRNLIREFPRKNNDNLWIGIGHASVPSALSVGAKEQYMAVSLSEIESLKYDYFALGHIHIQQRLSERVAYSGNIQGLNYKEIGHKGGYLIKLDGDRIEMESLCFNEVQWEAFDFELDESHETLSQLESELTTFVSEQIADIKKSANQLVVRVNLEGRSSLAHSLREVENTLYLEACLKRIVGLLNVDIKLMSVNSLLDMEMILSEKTVLSEALSVTRHVEAHEDLINRLLALPIYNGRDNKKEVLQKILETAEEELIDCFVRGK